MPKVSVNILTKNRAQLLGRALDSVLNQSFKDYEVIIIDDASTDETKSVLENYRSKTPLHYISQKESKGITANRQLALEESTGEYIVVLDDDDEWMDDEKLAKQVSYLDEHREVILVGGGIIISENKKRKLRPESDEQIRKTMLIRNNFFTSTVMFRKASALKAGGFIKDQYDFGEDYDLWLRLGKIGQKYNFQQAFAKYRLPHYNRARQKDFFRKQLWLINKEKLNYPGFLLASILLRLRIIL